MAKQKYILFDSSTIINMVSNGLSETLTNLKKEFKGEFIITPEVVYESIEHPKKIQRFEWGAIRIEELVIQGTLKEASKFFDLEELKRETQKVMELSNNTIFSEGRPIHMIEEGEAETIALSIILTRKGIENVVAMDERTGRMLCENPDNLRKIFEQKLHMPIELKEENASYFEDVRVIRSTELTYLAIKKHILNIEDKDGLEAVLFALKYGGTSITEREIQIMSKT